MKLYEIPNLILWRYEGRDGWMTGGKGRKEKTDWYQSASNYTTIDAKLLCHARVINVKITLNRHTVSKPNLFHTFVLCQIAQKKMTHRRGRKKWDWIEDALRFSSHHRPILLSACNIFSEIQRLIDLIVQGLSEIDIWSFNILFQNKWARQTNVVRAQFVQIRRETGGRGSYSPHFTTMLTSIYSWWQRCRSGNVSLSYFLWNRISAV